jgi:hypothetical protein
MIDLSTFAELVKHGYRLAAYCQRCDRWAVLDLTAFVDAGLGDRRLPITARRQACGGVGRVQVRPQVPTRGPAGWMEPPTKTGS